MSNRPNRIAKMPRRAPGVLRLIPVAFLLTSTISTASSPNSARPLFHQPTTVQNSIARESSRLLKHDDITLETFGAIINRAALVPEAGSLAGSVSNLTLGQGAPTIVGQVLAIPLGRGDVATVDITRVEEHIEGVKTYVGEVRGDPGSFVTLSFSKESMHGHIDTAVDRFEIEPIAKSIGGPKDLYAIRRLDMQTIAERTAIEPSQKRTAGPKNGFRFDATTDKPDRPLDANGTEPSSLGASLKMSGTANLEVLVIYTDDAAAERNMPTFISNLMSQIDQSFSASNVDASTNLAYSEQYLGYNEASRVSMEMNRLQNSGDQMYDFLLGSSGLIEAWDADLVVVIPDDDAYSSAPYGYGLERLPDEPFAIASDDYASADYTFTHELGHVFGGEHEHGSTCGGTTTGPGDIPGDHGFESPDGNGWTTMMGSCVGTFCTGRELFWSDANDTHPTTGEDLGEPIGNNCEADMKAGLNSTDGLEVIEDWRTNPPSAPPTPINLDVEKLQCYGQNTLNWSAGSGVGPLGKYQVFRSTSAGFTTQTLIYEGRDSAIGINIPSNRSPSYIRVRACNAGGCSSYDVGDETATYYAGCL